MTAMYLWKYLQPLKLSKYYLTKNPYQEFIIVLFK